MDNRPIGIFDSGVGGVTVFSKVIKVLPHEDIIYLGDTARLPYGTKSKGTIIEFTKQCIDILIKKNVKAIVIACGTASSQALEEIKNLYNIPIIGIIKPTSDTLLGINKKVGVIATSGTIKSNAWEEEIKKVNKNIEVISKACPLLVQMAEDGWTDNEIAKLVVKEYMKAFKKSNINKLILGCTHYPLFTNVIEQELGTNVEIINTGENCARYLEEILKDKGIQNIEGNIAKYKFYLTDTEVNFYNIANRILEDKYKIQKEDIELIAVT